MIKFTFRLSLAFTLCLCYATAVLSSAQLPLEARNAENSSEEEEIISNSYVLPKQIFNNGKPYYASKDPVSGQLDFNIKKSAGIDSAANEVIDPNEKAIITSSSPNIHDFLNLPVKYSSSKFVYPLVSSSYANLKYQGSNKNYITNKKPTQVMQVTSSSNYYSVPTTKLTPVAPDTPVLNNTSSITSTASTTTSKKPNIESISISNSTTVTSIPTSTSTSTIDFKTTTTTKAPIMQTKVSVESNESSQKYTTSTPKSTSTYSTTTAAPKVSTTHKKFVPSKKYTPTSSQTTSTSVHVFEQRLVNTTSAPKPTTSITTASDHPKTDKTVVFTEDPTRPPPFRPFPSSTRIPNLDAADVYHTLGQKNTENVFEQKPSMTLADIFNSLAEEESAVAANNPIHQGLDAQGNLIEPLDPSKPSPFTMHIGEDREQSQPTKPLLNTTAVLQQYQPQQSSGNQENFSNEYVSYQVQQPNIMQYRPAPGGINNVVISPGQNLASFVLGNQQQQVGQSDFGNVKKEPLFSKEQPVQYGTVINEDISGISRQPAPMPYQEMPNQPSTPNLQQNGNFALESNRPELQRPLAQGNIYQKEGPAPPTPYQQLPLIGKPSTLAHKTPVRPSQNQPLQLSNAIGTVQSVNLQQKNDTSFTLNSNQDTKELLVSTNIRFPTNEEQLPETSVISGPHVGSQINGHAQPISSQQIQNPNPIVFPKQEQVKSPQNEIFYQNSPSSNLDGVQIQKHEVLTMAQHQKKFNFPSTNEANTPAQHMVPPPPPNNIIPGHELQKPNRPQFSYNEYTRKPVSGITRPNLDHNLPNILPQFRPNAKISTGHTQQGNFNQEPGNIKVPGTQPSKRVSVNGNPQFSHRRQPLGGQPKRYALTRMANYPTGLPSPNEMANRRVYKLSPYGGTSVQYLDRPGLHLRRTMPHNLRVSESMNVERLALAPTLDKLPAFEEEDLVINDPPQSVTPNKEASLLSEAKFEPVVTLQMLQSQKKAVSLPNDDSGDGEIQVPSLDNNESGTGSGAQNNQNGLYVVYPIENSQKSETVDGLKSHNALPVVTHLEPPTGIEYQNTPFSIIRDQQQEPVLKNKKPLSLQQKKLQKSTDSFPYPIEKPNPLYSEKIEISTPSVPGVIISAKIKNDAYGIVTEAPIAIAYTPTEPSRHKILTEALKQRKQHTIYSNINLATPIIGEIRPDSQTETVLNDYDFDIRAQNYEKNFMAPFYPSISLDSVTNIPTNGWNILPSSSTSQNFYEKNNIDRSDIGTTDNRGDEALEFSTKSFEMDKFQPELQGGFKPIYPPGYKLDSEQEEQEQLQYETNNVPMPLVLASHMEQTQKLIKLSEISSTSSTTTTTTSKPITDNDKTLESTTLKPTDKPSTTTTSKPTKRTKSKFETSLAALLFGEDEEDVVDTDEPVEQTQARQETTNAMVSGPRSIPRMGPRNLKI